MNEQRTIIVGILVIAIFLAIAPATRAQNVIIPDPGLNAAVRQALNKPTGPLTQQDMLGLTVLNAQNRNISNLAGLEAARNLNTLLLFGNRLTNFSLPVVFTNMAFLNLSGNSLRHLSLPVGMTNLFSLLLANNALTNVSLPADLTRLEELNLGNNQLSNINLPSNLNGLGFLGLSGNQLTNLTLPSKATNLAALILDGNPLATLVVSEPLAEKLAAKIASLRDQGVNVFTFPLAARLTKLQHPAGAVRFGIKGPPGVHVVFSSTNLIDWTAVGAVNNPLGGIFFTDASTSLPAKKFYRAQFQTPSLIPSNMVFISANTFKLGSPTNEVGHRADESPQTTVTLTHGFWMSKYLVTQRDYLALIGENPSGFPGDLNRPVESVSWFAASNYCAKLTEQDLAAGRIPAGTHYRLPTEAEWECAARAGSTTRFYYGDDAGLTDLTNHAWFGVNSGFTTRPVGQKIPNAWGLYDMAGNVWEWCQDWYGTYPGGSVADPQGPASNAIGFKVIRGGAWEASELDCRSARRWFQGASPFITDFIIGFRVVLVIEPQ